MSSKAARVAITGFAGLDNPEPGTSVARSLREGWEGRLEIEALGYDPWVTGAWSPGIADHISIVPPLAAGDDNTLRRILEIDRERKLDAIIPCLDLEIPVYGRLASKLDEAGIKTLLPPSNSLKVITKTALPAFCHRHDIPAPKTVHVRDMEDVAVQTDQFGYPLVVKGTVAGAHRVANADQAVIYARELNAKWGGGVLLQQCLRGEEYTVAMVARGEGTCLGMVSMRKLGVNYRGKGVVGAVVDDPALEAEAKRILEVLNWRGPVELEFIKPTPTGQFTLIEINCRLPCWILLTHWAGCNLPALLLREILTPGQHQRRMAPRPRAGVAFVRDIAEFPVLPDRFDQLERRKTVTGTQAKKILANGANGTSGLCVGVTGVSAFNFVMPGIGVAQSLRHEPGVSRLIGIGYGPYDTGIHRHGIFDEVYTLPDTRDHGATVKRIAEIKELAGLDVLIPTLDFEVEAIASAANELRQIGLSILLPSADALSRSQKKSLASADLKASWSAFEIPETAVIGSRRALESAAKSLGFPLMIKGLVSGASIAHSLEEAHALWQAMTDESPDECLVQRCIRGDEFAVAAVCDNSHRIVQSVTIKKLLKCERGNTWGAIRIDAPDLTASLDEFLSSLKFAGPVEAEFIRETTTEKFYLIEINPRFPAWIRYAANIGFNLPLLNVHLASHQPAPTPVPNGPAIFMRSCEELPVESKAFASLLTKGQLSLG